MDTCNNVNLTDSDAPKVFAEHNLTIADPRLIFKQFLLFERVVYLIFENQKLH